MHALLIYKTLSVFGTAHTPDTTRHGIESGDRGFARFSARLQLWHGAAVRSYCSSPLFNRRDLCVDPVADPAELWLEDRMR
jgi:hypothetical protein